ncbi:MAG: hypothetical protein JWM65_2964 [Sphingomonas bacterium]|nr:hypothetical protein [Sphingomonas bacterium]
MAGAAGEGLMTDDSFETVAIIYSQPEAAVLLGLFAQHDIVTEVVGARHVAVNPVWTVALGGIIVRVQTEALEDARALLAQIARQPQAMRRRLIDNPVLNGLMVVLACFLGIAPIPPTRVGSTFLLGDMRRLDDQPQG